MTQKHHSNRNHLVRFLTFVGIFILGIVLLVGLVYMALPKDALPNKVFRVAIDQTWYPLQLYDKEEYITAFSTDLMRAIADEQHFSVEFVNVGSFNLYYGLDHREYDAVLSSLVLLGANSDTYITSDPYYLLGPVLVVSTSSDIKSLKDLNGKTVGVITRSNPVRSLEKYPNIVFVFYEFKDREKLIDDVRNHLVAGMILDLIPAYEYMENGLHQNQLKVASVPLDNEGLHLIAENNSDSKKLIYHFNEGLKALKKNGIYDQLLEKWELVNPERSRP